MRDPALRVYFDRRKLVVDLFAGGGGTSEGIDEALGFSPDIAANHDPEAVAMHAVNHPKTRHYIEDVRKLDIPKVTAGRQVGLLWLSPDCKHYSIAKGGKPVDRKIRGLAWEAVRWAEEARPDVIILENVKEFRGWGPVRRADNKPCPKRKGMTYRQFKRQLEELGYQVEDRNLRACDYGAPTSRERLFLVARCDGRPIVWPEPTHAEGGKDGLEQWRTAGQCIYFGLPTPSIFLTKRQGRALGIKRPLAKNTKARIRRGVFKFVIEEADPFVVPVLHGPEARAWSVHEPARTITGAKRGDQALVMPYLVRTAHGEAGPNSKRWGKGESIPARDFAVVAPVLVGAGGPARAGEPASTDRPIGTLMPKNDRYLVAPVMVPRYGERQGQEPRAQTVTRPISTIVPTKNGAQLVAAFLAQHNGGFYDRRGGAGRDARMPISTITAAGSNQQLVAVHVLKLKGNARSSAPVSAPLHTIQAGGLHYAQVCAFLMKYHGTGGQWGKVGAPAPTVVANDSIALVLVRGQRWVIVDIGMRMLTPRELFRCQGFSDTYIIDPVVELVRRGRKVARKLSGTAQVRMVGNSVPPQFARALVEAQFAAGEERAAA